jgi:hypothetical protein
MRSDVMTPDSSQATTDTVFESLVHVANTTDVEMRVTLHVNGLVVTGKLISGATFWTESADDLGDQGSGPSEFVGTLASEMRRLAADYRDAYAEDAGDHDREAMSDFVHLRDARTLTPYGPVPSSGALWRGRMASVDGFSLGELVTQS